jgi:hypothetical protein
MKLTIITLAGVGLIATWFLSEISDNSTSTLYRNSVTSNGGTMRIHVATFDANDGYTYNQENCELVRELLQSQNGVRTSFWCERGRFKK